MKTEKKKKKLGNALIKGKLRLKCNVYNFIYKLKCELFSLWNNMIVKINRLI